jgi:PAT family beta-lactamase induction signal transducer AmpG
MMNAFSSRFGRLFSFGILYLSEGIPVGFTTVAMAAYMRRDGMDVAQIGTFVGMLYLPWGFKWAWAPLVDLLRLNRFGGRKAWILMSLSLMMLTLVALTLLDYQTQFGALLTLVIIHNIFAATQDVAIDSLAVTTLRDGERGTANGIMFGSAYVGMGLGGSLALMVLDRWGLGVSLSYVSVLLALVFIYTLLWVRDPDVSSGPVSLAGDLIARLILSFKSLLREMYVGMFKSGKGPIFGVLFALTPLGAMGLMNVIGTTVKVDYGLSDAEIGELSLYVTVLSGLGCLLGGILGDRFGLRRMIALFYILSALPALYLAYNWGDNPAVPSMTVSVFYAVFMAAGLCNGLHYGINSAVYMGLTNPKIAATQFTAFMALSNLTIYYTNTWQGHIAEHINYVTVLYWDAALVLIPLLVLPFLTPRKA